MININKKYHNNINYIKILLSISFYYFCFFYAKWIFFYYYIDFNHNFESFEYKLIYNIYYFDILHSNSIKFGYTNFLNVFGKIGLDGLFPGT